MCITADDMALSLAAQPDNIRSRRWWTLDELRSTSETVYPVGLAELLPAPAGMGQASSQHAGILPFSGAWGDKASSPVRRVG